MMSRRWGAWALGRWVLGIIIVAGCSAPQRPSASAPDSAGITIVASIAPVWGVGRGWVVADTPTVDIANVGAPVGAVRLSDGRIVVGDGQGRGLGFFSAAGKFLYDVGGRSDGRDALRALYRVDRIAGDTVVVFDLATRRVVFYDPNGALALVVAIPDSLNTRGTNGYLPRGPTADGQYLLQRDQVAFPFAGAIGAILTDSTRLFWLSRNGSFADSSARLPAGELFGFPFTGAHGEQIVAPLARPLAPSLHVVPGVEAGKAWGGDGSTWEIWGRDARGRLVGLVRTRLTRASLTPALRDTFIARLRAQAELPGAPTMRKQFAAGLATVPFPDRVAAFTELLVGRDSTLWAQHAGLVEGNAGDATLVWSVFDPTGRWSGEVTMPPHFRPTEVGHGWVLGIWRDPSDVPHIRLYPLVEH